MQYATGDPAFMYLGFGDRPGDVIVDLGSEVRNGRAEGEMGGHGREDVPSVERVADFRQHETGLGH